ncbi:amidophosphoribosyltransferase [Defluviitalea phaphyphila]|uniref:amidophosphoribosyltransferase n=1 Tax=Defluviitalea phaphyphila TaxID=1473580 RepID=UPI0007314F05|nr:amidophosphoribosyltransferase [Defluviitalea phaphyphila]
MDQEFFDDKFHDECGIFGIFNKNDYNTAKLTYFGLYALQHRGQESAGIAVNDNGTIIYHKEMGTVSEVFDEVILSHLQGKISIGHVRYSTAGESLRENAQPLVIKYTKGNMAIAHNGNLVNADEIRDDLEKKGFIFQTTTDSEVIAALLSRERIKHHSLEDALVKVMKQIRGAYSLLVMTPHKLIAARDPLGMRPLCLGKKGDSYIFSSETAALDTIGAEFIRDINPGEIVVVNEKDIRSIQTEVTGESRMCIFEYIYFARPDSIIEGASVYKARLEAGKRLAREFPVDADLVIGVPDSGLVAALGYSRESGIPYGDGLMKNRYIGRTFIQPSQEMREQSVRLKLNTFKEQIEGKKIIMIDDSIVRGTTSKRIVNMLREAGAKEIHMRISSPPVTYPCYFGIDTPHRQHLIASHSTVEEIRKIIGADTLQFLTIDSLKKTPVGARCGFCTACFDGNYPVKVGKEGKNEFRL